MAGKRRFGLSMQGVPVSRENRNSIAVYTQEVNKLDVFSAKEELKVFESLRDAQEEKDKKILVDQIVSHNLRLVIHIAKIYQGKGLDLEDLIQHGNVGLITAVSKYDLSRGTRFSTYAVWWIRQSILRGIQNECRMVRIPTSAWFDAEEIRNVILDLIQEYGREPQLNEIVERSQKSLRAVERMLKTLSLSNSSNLSPSHDEDVVSRLSLVACTRELSPSKRMEVADLIFELKGKIAYVLGLLELPCMNKRDRDIFRAYYLCERDHEGKCTQTLDSIGKEFELTRERVRQICFRIWKEFRVLKSPLLCKEDLFETFKNIELLQDVLDLQEDPRLTPPATFLPKDVRRFVEKIIIFRHSKKKMTTAL